MKYDELDPGIREVVRVMRDNGFRTTDSGDGVSKPADHRALNIPHVFAVVVPADALGSECDRLAYVLRQRGVRFSGADPLAGPVPHIEGTYDPIDRTAVIGLYYVTSEMIR